MFQYMAIDTFRKIYQESFKKSGKNLGKRQKRSAIAEFLTRCLVWATHKINISIALRPALTLKAKSQSAEQLQTIQSVENLRAFNALLVIIRRLE